MCTKTAVLGLIATPTGSTPSRKPCQYSSTPALTMSGPNAASISAPTPSRGSVRTTRAARRTATTAGGAVGMGGARW